LPRDNALEKKGVKGKGERDKGLRKLERKNEKNEVEGRKDLGEDKVVLASGAIRVKFDLRW